MIKSKHRILPLILRLIVLIIGILAGTLSLFFCFTTIAQYEPIGLVIALIFSVLSMAFIYLGTESLKTILIDLETKTITITYLGFFVKKLSPDDHLEFANKTISNNAGTFKSILVQSKNSGQLTFSSQDFKNFNKLSDAVSKVCVSNKYLKYHFVNTFSKFFYYYLGIVVIIMTLMKLVQ